VSRLSAIAGGCGRQAAVSRWKTEIGYNYVGGINRGDTFNTPMSNDFRRNLSIITHMANEEGIDLLGVAGISHGREHFHQLPASLLEKLPLAIVIGVGLSAAVLDSLEDAPNLVYLHHYRQINAHLDQVALKISQEITRLGYLSVPIAASQLVDWEKQLGHVSHKELARLAGLGWRGRNNLLVTEQWGAQVRLSSILTDFPLEAAKPVVKDCGNCFRCLSSCPVEAIKKELKDFDSAGCYNQLKEFKKQTGIGHHICGLCVKVCAGVGRWEKQSLPSP